MPRLAFKSKSMKEEIFHHVCVCRTFRINGLQAILQGSHFQIEPPLLLMAIGDLNASYHLHNYIGSYIVDHDKARYAISKWDIDLLLDRHNAWIKWYKHEFEKKGKVEDLAELLYHEAAYFKNSPCSDGNIVNFMKSRVVKYLLFYIQEVQRQGESRQIENYIVKAREQLTTEKLNRTDWIFTDSEFGVFIEFLDQSISILMRQGCRKFVEYLKFLQL